ncbi:MAG: methylmalonyl-CoA epimerase [Halanaerobiales bacterium]|nr:methylmalonyl-CoA epimerase [Halanaerobiales bacterium]
MKIDHIGIAVKNIDSSLKFYKDTLGLEFKGTEILKERGLKVAFLQTGESKIELLEPISEDSTISKFIDKKGEGIHHLAIYAKDLDQKVESMQEKGTKFIGEANTGAGGKKIIFIHPKTTNGVLLELCQNLE